MPFPLRMSRWPTRLLVLTSLACSVGVLIQVRPCVRCRNARPSNFKEGSARVLLSALASTRRPRDNFAHLRADDVIALGASTLLTLRPGQCARILHPKDLSWAALSACVAAGTLSLLTMLLAACATGGKRPWMLKCTATMVVPLILLKVRPAP